MRNLSDADKLDLAETKRELIASAQPRGGRPSKDENPDQNFGQGSGEDKHERETGAEFCSGF